MRSTLVTSGLAVLALALAGCGGGGSSSTATRKSGLSRPTRVYRVQLSGAAETPPGAPAGAGTAIIAFHGPSRVCWRFAHLRGFTHATFAHIHIGDAGHAGNIVIALSTGRRLHHHGCVSVSPAVSNAIWSSPSGYYVNIHSRQYPGGAVRAQL
ncbi:MAG TPA: CHRD domain-containing protein [Solirubrobacteraceae bacterium]